MNNPSPNRFHHFLWIWSGQFLSTLGSAISGFALSVWILEKTESPTAFAVSLAISFLPGVIFSPIAGSLSDRSNRQKIIIYSDAVDALIKLIFLFLILTNHLTVLSIYLLNFLSSTAGVFQGPAFSASLPNIVDKEDLGRANGMLQINMAVKAIVAPILGGLLYDLINLSGIFILDFLSFFFAIATMLAIKIPQPQLDDQNPDKSNNLWQELRESWSFIQGFPGMTKLFLLIMLFNGFGNLALALVGPLVLAQDSAKIYGLVNACFGIGFLVGSLVSTVFPAKHDLLKKALLAFIPSGFALMLMGLSANYWLIALGGFLFFLTPPYANSTFGTLLQVKFPPQYLGRLFALVQTLISFISPLAMLAAGPLAEKIFIPLLLEGGRLDNTLISQILGTGPSRGIGLLFILCGMLIILIVFAILLDKNILSFEDTVADYQESN